MVRGPIDSFRIRAGCQKDQSMFRRLKLWAPPHDFHVGERLEVELITNDLVNHTYLIKLPQKPLNDRIQRVSSVVNIWRCWEGDVPREGMEALCPFPLYLALCISSILLFLSCILYSKLTIISKMFSWVLSAIIENCQIWGWDYGNSNAYLVVQKYTW